MLWGALYANALAMGLSGALMPGPLLTTVITQTAKRGFSGGLAATAGHALLELGLVLALAIGVGQVLTNRAMVTALYLVGGAMLVWLGQGTVRHGIAAWRAGTGPSMEGSDAGSALPGPITSGVVATAGNPYWFLWWATAGAGWLAVSLAHGPVGAVAFYLGHVTADFLWYGLVAGAVAGGRGLLGPRSYGGLLGGCGVFLVGLGVWFVLAAVRG